MKRKSDYGCGTTAHIELRAWSNTDDTTAINARLLRKIYAALDEFGTVANVRFDNHVYLLKAGKRTYSKTYDRELPVIEYKSVERDDNFIFLHTDRNKDGTKFLIYRNIATHELCAVFLDEFATEW